MGNKPKYKMLKDYILNLIKNDILKDGDKLFSENELSSKFDISRHTVRQAIQELTNEGYLRKVHGKGTYVSLKKEEGKTIKTIGIVTTYINDYIFPSIIKGIDSILTRYDYNYILNCTFNSFEKEKAALTNLLNQNIAGVIVEPTQSAFENPNLHLYQQLLDKGIKILFIHGSYKSLNLPYIAQDDYMGGVTAARFLTQNGFKNIGGIFKYNDIQGRLRKKGFSDITNSEEVLWFNEHALPPDSTEFFTTEEGREVFWNDDYLNDFIKGHDALVIYNEQIAMYFFNKIHSLNIKIPDDLSIVTFDNSEISDALTPNLTTIAHPKEKLGQKAASMMIKLLNDNSIAKLAVESVKIKPEIIIRDSVKFKN